jgi:D-beta-D-heptose 7-phosphate kinase/D-beta-D-heptose 1-phosphate adenosyltransferase
VEAITPNRRETRLATGILPVDAGSCEEAAERLLRELALEGVFITLDKDGIFVRDRAGAGTHFPTKPRAVYDVAGAGDMVLSVVAMVLAAGYGYREAARLANVAGGIEIQRIGVCPVSLKELSHELLEVEHAIFDKIKTPDEIGEVLAEHRRRRERIVFTNGCFDMLHIGHLRLLQFSRRLGDLLVVGLNSDSSIRALKGAGRPILGEGERSQILAALAAVDYIVLFDELEPLRLIERVRPHVLVKGEDYRDRIVVGREFVESYGGRVELAPLVEGISTTEILNRILGNQGSDMPAEESAS